MSINPEMVDASDDSPLIIDIRQYTSANTGHSNSSDANHWSYDYDQIQEHSSREWSQNLESESNFSSSCVIEEKGYQNDLVKQIILGLTAGNGEMKSIPTVVLYDDKGLQIYDKITYLEEYYLVQEETDILHAYSDDIVKLIPDDSIVVELGSGSLRKTSVLLEALEDKRKNIHYYALDLMKDELTKSLLLLGGYKNVKTAGLWGTYEEGLAFITSLPSGMPKTILWLGSSIGNLTRNEAKNFITAYRKILNVGDNWLIGVDRRNSPKDITLAYNDPKSVTREFILNGLDHVNSILGQQLFDRAKFDYYGTYNEELGRHEAYYKSLEKQILVYKNSEVDNTPTYINIEKGELINVEYSYKWSLEESTKLFDETKMTKIGQWASPTERYDLYMLQKFPFYFQCGNTSAALAASPSVQEWIELWNAWNFVTDIIQKSEMVMEKPIELRHPFLFYIGHIPAFLDIQLSKFLNEPLTSPSYYQKIFERGIDPEVEDPSKCHNHSTVPEIWPELSDILAYRDAVYKRLIEVLNNVTRTRRLDRVLFMGFEHQAMHLETLMYMMVQSPNVMLPMKMPFLTPTILSKDNLVQTENLWIKIIPEKLEVDILSLGINDNESKDNDMKLDLLTPFGWDNETPKILSNITSPFAIQSRQITNAEFLEFVQATKCKIPSSWIKTENSNFLVKTIFGTVSLAVARDWPVACSQKEASKYIDWINTTQHKTYSLPTEQQLSIAFKLKEKLVKNLSGSSYYGFRLWYPSPLNNTNALSNNDLDVDWNKFQGPGPLWDWTNTQFSPLDPNFSSSELYPGYSSDFFDGKHFVMLGASWATHPRIAERKSFRNFYQSSYPYVFGGFRLVDN